jgi:transcriptional regulator with XRE-family HTH domain
MDTPDHEKFVARYEAGLRAKGLNQSQLARLIGVSQQYLSQMKFGEQPALKHRTAIAAHLGCTVEWLNNGTGEAPSWASHGFIPELEAYTFKGAEAGPIMKNYGHGALRQTKELRAVVDQQAVEIEQLKSTLA